MNAPQSLPLASLRKAIAAAQDLAHDLSSTSPPQAYDPVADALYAAYDAARDLASPRGLTGCAKHPQGAIDTRAPDGWGSCLVCNTHRRRANIHDHTVHTHAAKARRIAHLPDLPPAAELPPGYEQAFEKLRILPDHGIAALEAARAQHGDLPYAQLVMHAAAQPIHPGQHGRPVEQNTPEHPGTAPTCGDCGTVLDPNQTCWTCTRRAAT